VSEAGHGHEFYLSAEQARRLSRFFDTKLRAVMPIGSELSATAHADAERHAALQRG
jgi:hypothetical protein